MSFGTREALTTVLHCKHLEAALLRYLITFVDGIFAGLVVSVKDWIRSFQIWDCTIRSTTKIYPAAVLVVWFIHDLVHVTGRSVAFPVGWTAPAFSVFVVVQVSFRARVAVAIREQRKYSMVALQGCLVALVDGIATSIANSI